MRVSLLLLVFAWWLISIVMFLTLAVAPPEELREMTDNLFELAMFMLFNAGVSSVSLFYVLYGKHSDK